MKKKIFTAAAIILAAAAMGACSNQNTSTQDQSATEAQTQAEQETSEVSEEASEAETAKESDNEAVSEETAEEVSEKEEGLGGVNLVETKILNKTGKVLNNVNIKLSSSLIGLDTLKDGESAVKEIPADEDGFILAFEAEDGETKLPIGKEALGFKVIVYADDANGYLTDIVGIDEED